MFDSAESAAAADAGTAASASMRNNNGYVDVDVAIEAVATAPLLPLDRIKMRGLLHIWTSKADGHKHFDFQTIDYVLFQREENATKTGLQFIT